MLRQSAVVLTACTFLPAQVADYPVVSTPVLLDSGFRSNPTAGELVVWSQDVTVPGGFAQLRFRDTNLPAGSRLRVFSQARPEWVQWHDAHSLRDYRGHTCEFLGGTLTVELVAAPHSTGNRAVIDQTRAHLVDQAPDTICGPTDDRVLSTDPRAGRMGGCTAWLFGTYAVGSAGHCLSSTSGLIVHFNVPLSTASGGLVPAHPNDQYALEAFLQRLNGGVGQDWAAMAAVRNSNTGLFPGQAQGGHYDIVPAPAAIAGDIRITGYGTGNGTSGSPTWNRVQKTHVGPRVSTTTANALRYQTDTTGGNSGSPVIHEQTGQVIGVHTHGGCSSTGTGGNSGTNAARSDWTAARAQVLALHTVGETATFGIGCGGAAGVPALSFTGIPEIGRLVLVRTTGLHAAVVLGWMVVGFNASTWNGAPLPAGLDPFGIEGCQLWISGDLSQSVGVFGGVATFALTVPNSGALVGSNTYFQYLALDGTAPNTLGVSASNAGRLLLGN